MKIKYIRCFQKLIFLLGLICLNTTPLLGPMSLAAAETRPIPEVRSVPEALRKTANLSPFYQKHTHVGPLPILGSAKVSDYALREAAWIVQHMLTNRADILQALADNHVRMVIMAYNEYTTDIPEQTDMKPKAYWDRRARGLGGQIISGAEENLLCFPNDPYSTENILIHEFGHVIHEMALCDIDPTFDRRLRAAYKQARQAGLWEGTYAGSNHKEYWAEAVQDWFDNNRENDRAHNHINTRAELKAYDPNLAKLCAEVFGEIPWRYKKPMERSEADRAHLAGYDFPTAPRFEWRHTPLPDKPRVLIRTELGDIEVELFHKEAPITVKNFIRYVRAGLYSNGSFFRTVTMENQPNDLIKIQVIQAQANPSKAKEFFPPILLERTRDTGVKHLDGTLSMARNDPNTARDSFSICIGDQPELDFGGKRNPDGQGFAAFGKVIRGMDVVRMIHNMPAKDQQITTPIRIQQAVRIE